MPILGPIEKLNRISVLFFIFDRLTASKRFQKNPPTYKSTDHGLMFTVQSKIEGLMLS